MVLMHLSYLDFILINFFFFLVIKEEKNNIHLIRMRPVLMFCSVAGIAEGLGAAGIFTGVWLFSSMRSQVSFEIF